MINFIANILRILPLYALSSKWKRFDWVDTYKYIGILLEKDDYHSSSPNRAQFVVTTLSRDINQCICSMGNVM